MPNIFLQGQRRPSSIFLTVMFRGTPCILMRLMEHMLLLIKNRSERIHFFFFKFIKIRLGLCNLNNPHDPFYKKEI